MKSLQKWVSRSLLILASLAVSHFALAGGVVTQSTESSLDAALNGGGTVTFACDGTITIGAGKTISANTTIDASGHTITISGGNSQRIFTVNTNVSFTLINLTLANGKSTNGGAIYNQGTVTASNCVFSNNVAGGGNGANGDNGQNGYWGDNGGDGVAGGGGMNAAGGAIFSECILILNSCLFQTNTVAAGNGGNGGYGGNADPNDFGHGGNGGSGGNGGTVFGGAVYSTGGLFASNTTFRINFAKAGNGGNGGIAGTGNFGYGNYGSGGQGGASSGGAIYATNIVVLYQCTFTNNLTQAGSGKKGGSQDNGNGTAGGAAGSAYGGALCNDGTNVVTECVFHANRVIGGNGGNGGDAYDPSVDGNGSPGSSGGAAFGGALYSSVELYITNCILTSNNICGGNGGSGGAKIRWGQGGDGGSGGTGGGGAIFVLKTTCISKSVFADNSVTGGNGQKGYDETDYNAGTGANGGFAAGGGICNGGSLTLANCTLFRNKATGGTAGNGGNVVSGYGRGGNGGNGGVGCAGGMYCYGWTTLTNCTFSSGGVYGGTGGVGGAGRSGGSNGGTGSSGSVEGGNIYNAGNGTDLLLINTILAYALSGGNVGGSISNAGYNLSSDGTPDFATQNHSANNIDPKLAALADNGGFTKTCALLSTSPAIDAGDPANSMETDQRGYYRSNAPDIGAYEFNGAPLPAILVGSYGPYATRDGVAGSITIFRKSNNGRSLTVNYTLTGTASNGVDYAWITNTAVISSNGYCARIFIRALTNSAWQTNKTVMLTLQSGSGYVLDALYTNAAVTIMDHSTVDMSKRLMRGTGSDPANQSFVLPVDFEKGVVLDSIQGNATNLFPNNPWTTVLYHYDSTNPAPQLATNGRIAFQNPIVAFGSRVGGSPLFLNTDYTFGFYAGTPQLSFSNAFRIQAYSRSNSAYAGTITIPIPDPANTNQLSTFMTNGWTVTGEAYGLRTVLGTHPFDRWWGLVGVDGFIATHTATTTATNYFYVVEFKGVSGFLDSLVLNASGSQDWSRLYVMEFTERPASRVVFLDQPQFEGQPLPSVYQGKTLRELTNTSATLPNLSFLTPSNYLSLDGSPELRRHPILDQFVKDMGKDPLALANYVLNEIGLVDPMDYDTNQNLQAALYLGGVNRNALATYQEGQGSPLEQCALLVYLLRQAGVPAAYVFPTNNGLQMLDFQVSKLLQMQLRGAMNDTGETNLPQVIAFNYPWVALYLTNESRWVQVFPWLKDTEIVEGLDLYDYMPTNYNSGHKWLTQFLANDTNIFSLSDSDQPLVLFPKFIQKSLDTYHPGLSVDDMGVQIVQRRRLNPRWDDFPRPFALTGAPLVWESLKTNLNLFNTIQIRAYSAADPSKCVDTTEMRMADLHNRRLFLRFLQVGEANTHDMILSLAPYVWSNTTQTVFSTNADPALKLFATNRLSSTDDQIKFRVTHRRLRMMPSNWEANSQFNLWRYLYNERGDTGTNEVFEKEETFRKGDLVAFSFDVGRVTSKMLNVHAEEFWRQSTGSTTNRDPDVYQGTTAYLLGMSFFNYLDRFNDLNARLHKVRTFTAYQHGFGLIRPQRDTSGLLVSNGAVNLIEPAIHMPVNGSTFVFNNTLHPNSGLDYKSAHYDWFEHMGVQGSAAEHGALRSFYQTNAISTVKLLQLSGSNTLRMNRGNYQAVGDAYKLKDQDIDTWNAIVTFLSDPTDYAREVFATPGIVTNGTYRGMGALLLGYGQINSLVSGFNGGFAWQFPIPTFTDGNAQNITVEPGPDDAVTPYRLRTSSTTSDSTYLVNAAPSDASLASTAADLAANRVHADPTLTQMMANLNTMYGQPNAAPANGFTLALDGGVIDTANRVYNQQGEWVYDPVNIMSGEFYHDEVDLSLPGPMPLQVRRNYGSQNLAEGAFGFGWKINYVPYLSTNTASNLIYAAEMDGSVIAYRNQGPSNTNLWIPTAQDNPTLNNNSTAGVGSLANLFNARLQRTNVNGINTYTLTGADGSKRTYSERSYPVGGFARHRPYLDQWQDNRGNVSIFQYQEDNTQPDYGELRRIESSNGSFLGFYFDASCHIVAAYTGDGRWFDYEYDEYGDLVNVIRPDGSAFSYEYQHALTTNGIAYSTHLLVRDLKPDGRVLQNDYDSQRRVTNQYATVGSDLRLVRTATFLYTNNYNATNFSTPWTGLTVALDYTNNPTTYYYTNGLIRKTVDALNQTTLQEWYETDSGNGAYRRSLNWTQDKRGLLTTYKYDASGNVTNLAIQGNLTGDGTNIQAVSSFAFSTNNLLTNSVDASGTRNAYFYTNTWLLSRVEKMPTNGQSSSVIVEAMSYYNVTNAANASQWVHGLMRQRVRAAESGDAATNAWLHDARGFITNEISYTGSSDPNMTNRFFYNDRGELIEKSDAAGRKTRLDYDAMGRLIYREVYEAGQTVPLAGEYSYYNENGELTWSDGPRNNPEDYIWRDYDGAGRQTVEVRWRSRAKSDGSGVEALPDSISPTMGDGDGLYAVTLQTFDALDNKTSVINPLGQTTRMQYDSIGQMTNQVFYDSTGVALATNRFAYEPGGQVSVSVNPIGGATTNLYTSTGKLKERRNADGSTNKWLFYADGRLRREILVNGSYFETTYQDDARQVTRKFYNSSNVIQATSVRVFDRRGNLVSDTDLNGNTSTNSFDGLDRLKVAAGPSGDVSPQQSTRYFYDNAGIIFVSVNGLNETNVVTKDALGRVTSSAIYGAGTNGLVRYSASAYAPDGNSVTTVQGWGSGSVTNTVYTDTYGSPVLTVYGSSGQFTLNSYDRLGNLIASRDELGQTTTYAYDGLHRRIRAVLPDGATSAAAYDPAGNVLTNSMPGGLKSVSLYDPASRVTTNWLQQGSNKTNPYGFTYYTSGAVGLLQKMVDGRGLARTNTYDAWLRVQQQTWAGMTLAWHYDNLGHVTALEQSGANTDYSYVERTLDGYGQVKHEAIGITGGDTFSYFDQNWNAAGNRTQLASGAVQWNFQHRADGLLSHVGAFGQSYDYTYGNNGLLIQRSTPDRAWTATQRDDRGRLMQASTVVSGANVLAETMHWRANSTLNDYTADRSGSGTWDETRNYSYNNRGQLRGETLKPSSASSLTAAYGYDTNKLGVLTGAAFTGSFTNAWDAPAGQPDGFGRLTQEEWSIGQWERWTHGRSLGASNVNLTLDGQAVSDIRYSPIVAQGAYEARLDFGQGAHTLRGTAYHPSGMFTNYTTNTFTAPANVTLSEQYDGAGNVTNRTMSGGQSQTLVWDPAGRLVTVIEETGSTTNSVWNAMYDGFGRRLQTRFQRLPSSANLPVSTINQYFDPQVEFLEVGISINGNRAWKVHGPDVNGTYGGMMGVGGLEATVSEKDGVRTGLVSDFFGNGVATINGGVVKWASTPMAGYGPVLGFSPPYLTEYQILAEVSLYRGKRIDPTGFYWFGARYYDARAGRFLSPDPLGHGASWDLYSYADGDPLNHNDANGRCSQGNMSRQNSLPSIGLDMSVEDFFGISPYDMGPNARLNPSDNSYTLDQIGPGAPRDVMSGIGPSTADKYVDFYNTLITATMLPEPGSSLQEQQILNAMKENYHRQMDSPFMNAGAYEQGSPADNAGMGMSMILSGTAMIEDTAGIKYIGKLDDLKNVPRGQTLLDDLPDLGNAQANYYQNSSVLRKALRDGFEIRDASAYRANWSPDPTLMRPSRTVGQSFLGAERNILSNRGLRLYSNGVYIR